MNVQHQKLEGVDHLGVGANVSKPPEEFQVDKTPIKYIRCDVLQ